MTAAMAAQSPASARDWFAGQRTYPNRVVPEQALTKAFEQRLAMDQRLHPLDVNSTPPPATAVWAPLGPNGVNGPEGALSGRVVALSTDSRNPDHIYVAASGGGVWRSTDAGNTWTSLGDNLLSLSSGALTLDARNGNLYYGTGDPNLSGFSGGSGVLRSSDGGASWQQLSAQFNRGVTLRLATSPSDPNTLYAARSSGVWRSGDAGASWFQGLAGWASDVLTDPNDPTLIVAALGYPYGGEPGKANGVYRSQDYGNSWSLVGGLPAGNTVGRITLAKSASNPNVVYALLSRSADLGLQGIYRSDDSGANFHQLLAPPNLFFNGRYNLGDFDNMLAVDPRSPDRVYAGGMELYRSLDGGNSWTQISQNSSGQRLIHEGMLGVAFRPGNPDTIYVATEAGIYRSPDAGNNWVNLNRALPIAQFNGLAVGNGATAIIGGTNATGVIRLSADSTFWNQMLRGDAGSVTLDPNNSGILYTGFSLLGPRRSFDGGNTWSTILPNQATADGYGYFPPLVNDPVTPSTLLFGSTKVYRSVDSGNNWTLISPVLVSNGNYVTALAIAPGTRTSYAATSDGQVWSTQDAATWQSGAGVPNRYITGLAGDPRNPQRAFFTASGFGSGHVFVTQDGGKNWSDDSGNLPDAPANAVVVDPRGPVYVATDVGVFRSEDGGPTWTSFNLGLPNTFVTALALDASTGTLFAGTYGRGAWQVILRPPASQGGVGPQILGRGVVNSASFSVVLAPGAMTSIFGSGLARDTITNTSSPLARTLGGTSVTVNGVTAPLFFVSPNQINFQFPFEVTTSGANVVVTTTDGSAATFVQVAPAAPGIFAGSVTHPGGRVVDSSSPAAGGEVLTLYATGLGLTAPGVASGVPSPNGPAQANLPVTVTLGGASVNVQYAGLAPGLVALNQVNFVVPSGLTGDVPLIVIVGGRSSNVVTISLR